MRSWSTGSLGLAVVLALSACHGGPPGGHREHPLVVVETRAPADEVAERDKAGGDGVAHVVARQSTPAAGVLTHAAALDPGPPDTMVRIEPREQGWQVRELLALVSEKTGIVILVEPKAQQVNTARVEWTGTVEVPANRLLAWVQGVLQPTKIVLVPNGPLGATGRHWFALDSANPLVQSRAVFVHWEDVDRLADRDGLVITTVFPLADGVDASRLRAALSQLSTRTAALGRVTDLASPPAVIVTDYAPVVGQMRLIVLQMGVDHRGPTTDD